jgi:hypothetical protein
MAMAPASSCPELPGSRTDVRRGIRRLVRALICMGKATPLAASALAAKMSCTYTGICICKVAGMVLNGSPAPMTLTCSIEGAALALRPRGEAHSFDTAAPMPLGGLSPRW